MRPPMIAIAMIAAAVHSGPAAAQNFNDRWSIIPKAQAAEPPSAPTDEQREPVHGEKDTPAAATPPNGAENSQNHLIKQSFSGKAAFYSYKSGKTASGSRFDRDLLTAAHRTLPFGTRLRVTDVATNKSVTVVITDRGPHTRGVVLDLSLGAARTLGITDRGIARVRAEVL